jgi:hypothetical protein
MATKSTDLAPFVRQRQKTNLDEIDAYVGRREKKLILHLIEGKEGLVVVFVAAFQF